MGIIFLYMNWYFASSTSDKYKLANTSKKHLMHDLCFHSMHNRHEIFESAKCITSAHSVATRQGNMKTCTRWHIRELRGYEDHSKHLNKTLFLASVSSNCHLKLAALPMNMLVFHILTRLLLTLENVPKHDEKKKIIIRSSRMRRLETQFIEKQPFKANCKIC